MNHVLGTRVDFAEACDLDLRDIFPKIPLQEAVAFISSAAVQDQRMTRVRLLQELDNGKMLRLLRLEDPAITFKQTIVLCPAALALLDSGIPGPAPHRYEIEVADDVTVLEEKRTGIVAQWTLVADHTPILETEGLSKHNGNHENPRCTGRPTGFHGTSATER